MTWPKNNLAYAGLMSAPGAPGADGVDGLTVLNGVGAPDAGLGVNGDFYIDTAADAIYGPKAGGAWGEGTDLVGPGGGFGEAATIAVGTVTPVAHGVPPTVTNSGTPAAAIFDFELEAGEPGADGLTVLNGAGAPDAGLGVNGDFYIDTAADAIYGPKAGGAWGSPTSLIGPAGPAGGGHIIKDETTSRAARTNLNFTGAGVTATDNAGTDSTDVTIPGGAGGGDGWLVSQVFN